mgnify:CR=1 FL=1
MSNCIQTHIHTNWYIQIIHFTLSQFLSFFSWLCVDDDDDDDCGGDDHIDDDDDGNDCDDASICARFTVSSLSLNIQETIIKTIKYSKLLDNQEKKSLLIIIFFVLLSSLFKLTLWIMIIIKAKHSFQLIDWNGKI